MGRHIITGFALLFFLSKITKLGSCEGCIESERQALFKFKESILHDPHKILSSWDPKTNCCLWDGRACHDVTSHILKLNLSFHFLEATHIDPSLTELQNLIYLDLSWNNFNGVPIPISFGSMEQLRYLSIYYANFTGKIPANLGNLTNLKFLDLSWNYLQINDMNWVSKLQPLQHLNLNGVFLDKAHNLF
ncbi:receptor-like protein EIX2 [Prosopis cineraria]|uniref:receptor-like protein EIX2 n=1 Tax=Prosopis cineraria TaxID=364024 RepID=UPI00240EA0C0|nr:receptor-like protein EIX2 [Prosopis cineraria]